MAQFCQKCGAQIPEGSTFCSKCGAPVSNAGGIVSTVGGASTGLKILSFLFPIVGWILYFVFKDENIVKAKDCAKFGWIGFAVSFAIGFISGLAS